MSNTLFKKIVAGLSATALVLSAVAPVTGVKANNVEVDAANYLGELGIINHQSTNPAEYRLGDSITRGEMAKVMIELASEQPNTTCEGKFSDVSATTPNDWVCGYVERGLELGMLSANPTFRPSDTITNAEALRMVMGARGIEVSYDESNWQQAYVNVAVERGILNSASDFGNVNGVARRGNIFAAASATHQVTESDYVAAPSDDEDDFNLDDLFGDLFGDDDTSDETTSDETSDETTSDETSDETTTTPVVTGGNVEVTLNPATPSSATVPGFSTLSVAKYDITAGDSDVSVDSVMLELNGLGASAAVDKVTLFANGERVSRDRTFNSTTNDVNVNLTNSLVVKAGSTTTLDVVVVTEDTGTANGSEFAVALASMVTSAEIQGNMPVVGNTMKVGSVNAERITVDIDASLSDVNLGEQNVSVASFKIKNEADNNSDVRLSSITLRDGQNNMRRNLANIGLYVGTTKLAEVARVNDRYVTFSFDELTISQNQTQRFTVRADIVGGAGDDIELFLDNELDVTGKDTKYNFGLRVNNDYDSTNKSNVSILAGDLTVVGMDPTVTDVQVDKKDIKLGSFKIVSNSDQELELEKFTVSIDRTSGAFDIQTLFDNERMRLVNENTGSSYELDLVAGSTVSKLEFEYDPYMVLGKETTLSIYADIEDVAAANGTRFRLTLDTSNVNKFKIVETSDDETVENITPSSVTLRNLEIKTASAEIFRNNMLATRDVVVDSRNVEVLSFEVEAGSVSSVNFDIVEVLGDATNNVDSDLLTQARLYKGSVSDANLIASQSASRFDSDKIRFDGFNSVVVERDEIETFIVTVDVLNDENLDGDTVKFRLEDINLRDSDNDELTVTNYIAANYDWQTELTIKGTGKLDTDYLTTNSYNQYNKTVLGGRELAIASYELQAENEDIKVEEVLFTLDGNREQVSTITFAGTETDGVDEILTTTITDAGGTSTFTTTVAASTAATAASTVVSAVTHVDSTATYTVSVDDGVVTINTDTPGTAFTAATVNTTPGATVDITAGAMATTTSNLALDIKSAFASAKLVVDGETVATTPNTRISTTDGTILFKDISIVIPADTNMDIQLVVVTNTIGNIRLGSILDRVYVTQADFKEAEGISSGNEITFNATYHRVTTNSKEFNVVPATLLAAVQTSFTQSSIAEFDLRVEAGNNVQTNSNSKPVVNINQLVFTKNGSQAATDYELQDEDGATIATGAAGTGNDVVFGGLDIDITDVETLKIEVSTSTTDETYGLTLKRDGITYTVNGVEGLKMNSTQSISFGSKN